MLLYKEQNKAEFILNLRNKLNVGLSESDSQIVQTDFKY